MILKRKMPALTAAAFLLVSVLTITLSNGCTKKTAAESDGKLNIVTTTTMLYDLAVSIGGDLVNVTALMGPGIDPHLYQASAGDVTKMQGADIILYNGLHLRQDG